MNFGTVGVVGLGYIGLPSAAVIAARGPLVIGFDINPRVVDSVNRGEIHIVEPGLERAVNDVVARKRLRASTRMEPADVFMIAVPTPITQDKHSDITAVAAAFTALAPVLKKGDLVILESTCPVGTTRLMTARLAALRPDLAFPNDGETPDINVAYCPERVLPGHVFEELVGNDRALGGMTPRCAARAAQFYSMFVEGALLETTAEAAELCKLAENAYRDVNIAFANELANVCDKIDVNVWDVIALANRHPRVNILKPGPGVGGHCIAVDPWFIVESAPEETQLIQAARHVNEGRPHRVIEQIRAAIRARARPTTVACLGLSFKADIDDLRESPAVQIVRGLADQEPGVRILAVEPHIAALPPALESRAIRLETFAKAIRDADIVVVLVDHRAFGSLAGSLERTKILIDTRGVANRSADAGLGAAPRLPAQVAP